MSRIIWSGAAVVSLLLFAGCAAPEPAGRRPLSPPAESGHSAAAASQPTPMLSTASQPARPSIDSDPRGYLERVVLPKCGRLTEYTTRLIRYERRGLLFKTLEGPETIQAWFRCAPFSVRLCWLDPNIKYGEAVFIDGVAGNDVRFVPRKWYPPLLPGINRVSVMTPVIWGETLNPITDFGLQRLAERLREKLAAAGAGAKVTYRGRVTPAEFDTAVHHVEVDFPATSAYPQPHQDLYVDVDSELLVGVVLKTAPDREVHAAYYYTGIDDAVRLTDADFRLFFERGEPLPQLSEMGK